MHVQRFKMRRSSPIPVSGKTSVVRASGPGRLRLLSAALALLTISGCATTDPRDPFEPLNRVTYEVNDVVDKVVIKPVAEVYTAVVPETGRTGVSNFFGNIYDIWNVVNNALQGKIGAAFSDAGRIALNTTVGLLGFVDVASKVGLEKSDEDLGQTLGWWGIGHGPYIVLPFLGPSSLRDSVGTFTQVYFDPTWAIDDDATIWALWGLRVISLRSNLLGAERVLDTAASDRYTFLRDAYFQRRRSQLWDGNPPREKEFSGVRPQTPSLVVLPPVWLRPADPQQAESAGGNGQTEEASASAAPIQISGNVLN